MPVHFLSPGHYKAYGHYNGTPSDAQLARFFYLDHFDHQQIGIRRREQNRLGFALQLATVRFLGVFVVNLSEVPGFVVAHIARQLAIDPQLDLSSYQASNTYWDHQRDILEIYGYRQFHDQQAALPFLRWLYTRAWIGAERPSVLFDLATAWLIDHKILLPGVTVLERLVSTVRERIERRTWRVLSQALQAPQKRQLQTLLAKTGDYSTRFDLLRQLPTRVSTPQMRDALLRLHQIRGLKVNTMDLETLPVNRIKALGEYALTARTGTLRRLHGEKRLAVLLAGVRLLEIRMQDLILDIFEQWLAEAIARSKQQVQVGRLRTLEQFDRAAFYLRDVGQMLLKISPQDPDVLNTIFQRFARTDLEAAIAVVNEVKQPFSNNYREVLVDWYRSARFFLPGFLQHLHFEGVPQAQEVLNALAFLGRLEGFSPLKPDIQDAPRSIISTLWRPWVFDDTGDIQRAGYTLCALQQLYRALRRRDIYVALSEKWYDPRCHLLSDEAWQQVKSQICRTLQRSPDPRIELAALSAQLNEAYRNARQTLTDNPDLRLEEQDGHLRPILTPLEALPESPHLLWLRNQLHQRLPHIDLPDFMLEVHTMTGFAQAFTHISEQQARSQDMVVSICAVLLAQACNIDLRSVMDEDIPALCYDRLRWVQMNYIRPETIIEANDRLIQAQSEIRLARLWGGGEVASADGLRFVVPKRAVHGRHNRKYFGTGRGVTFFNFLSDQFTGFHNIVIPGAMREALYILDGLLEQTSRLQPKEVMTDSGSYTDVVFGLFWLLGYQFSPRLADLKRLRFWRIDRQADYGPFDDIARHRIRTNLIEANWEDMLRIAGSLKTGVVSASQLMRTFYSGSGIPTLTKAIRELGRIAKTLFLLQYIQDEGYRRRILISINHGEARHTLARQICYGNRGKLKHSYRRGQEEQLGALGLVLNLIVYWNTRYLDLALSDLEQTQATVHLEELDRITPLISEHIRILGRYDFALHPFVRDGRPRPLRSFSS